MANLSLFRLRVTFCKLSRLAMLSHLEVARALERTVRRANLPFAISNGFSPHMRIAFGAALPVGVGGTSEIFDVFLTSYISPSRALHALQSASAPDLMCVSCTYIEQSEKAASVAFPISTYEAKFSAPIDVLEVPKTITVMRKRKEKVLRVADFLVGALETEGECAHFSLESKPTGSLRPDLLMRTCLEAYNASAAVDATSVTPAAGVAAVTPVSAAAGKDPVRLVSLTRTSQRSV